MFVMFMIGMVLAGIALGSALGLVVGYMLGWLDLLALVDHLGKLAILALFAIGWVWVSLAAAYDKELPDCPDCGQKHMRKPRGM